MPEVTVLMPVHNAERFLEEAVQSILQQTFTDFEFLIIDDGSTDRSPAIIQSFGDSRIRFIKNESNLGISETLNKGITLATCDLIARMDADDISYPQRLDRQYSYFQAHPGCALVSSTVRVISEDKRHLWTSSAKEHSAYYNLTFLCDIFHPSVMYRKQAVQEFGMYSVPFAEDYNLWSKLIRKFKIYNLPEVLLDYRVSDSSISFVTKKQEYDQAERAQILSNMQYYAGEDYTIPQSFMECFRNNYQPLLAEQSVSNVVACIQELDQLTALILAKENVNRDITAIIGAANIKRKRILDYFITNLSLPKATLLTALLGTRSLFRKQKLDVAKLSVYLLRKRLRP